ncbi:Sodium/alanine symporter family protein [hydrothermal vent metagenome]|uniref:Sodium/alanine symporter family protein n=1 Tax=hydrothermal vent metagenome TaxID=652676 RepID=A0A1W1EDD7_9ZZZZ
MEAISSVIDFFSNALWSYVLIYTLIPIGLYFSYKLGFAQFLHIGHMFKLIKEDVVSAEKEHNKVSSWGAFTISSASRVGTGNLAGVAIAITMGGAGAVFWMWVIALVGAASSMIENTLAQAYKKSNGDGTYRGGPAYYMAQGIGSKKMGLAFSILITIAFGLVFNSVQSNTIANAFHNSLNIDPTVMAGALAVFTAVIIFGGLKRIVSFTQVVFPAMAGLYLVAALIVIVMNIGELPAVFAHIFQQAFGMEQAATGAFAFMVMQGIKRGLFSNEAGMGSTPNAGATAEVSHPVKQGYIQTLGVFVDTLIISTATAFIILITNTQNAAEGLNGIQLTQAAMHGTFGEYGGLFVAFIVLLFSFSSIIGNYYYGESNIEYMTESKLALNIFRVLVVFMVAFGAIAKIGLVWNLADVFMGFMALLNMIALLMLKDVAFKLFKDYRKQLKEGKNPIFHRDSIPELKDVECWDNDHNFLHLNHGAKKL